MSVDATKVEAGAVDAYASGIIISALEPGMVDYDIGIQFTELLFDHTGACPVDLILLGFKPKLTVGVVQVSDETFLKMFPYLTRDYTSATDYQYQIGFGVKPGTLLSTYAKKWKLVAKNTGQLNAVIQKGIPVAARSISFAAGKRRVFVVTVFGIVDFAATNYEMGQIGPGAA